MRIVLSFAWTLLLVGTVGMAGCSFSEAPAMGEYVDVKGTVSLADGKPVKKATIFFQPEGAVGREQFTDIKDGQFALKLFVAPYKVAFDTDLKKSSVPAKYTKFNTTDLKLDVQGGIEDAKFALK